MVVGKEVYIPSTNGKNQLHVWIWKSTDKEPKAVLQISHGMVEHIARYKKFAQYMAERGIIVVGNDHLGHGGSVASEAEFGYFNASNPSQTVVADLYAVTQYMKNLYPDLPYFLLGHSMGSFMARRYLMTYGKVLNGAIIMGTGQFPRLAVALCKPILAVLKKIKGGYYRSIKLNQLSFGNFNNQFNATRTTHDWLSRNEVAIDEYLSDPQCNFLFTLNGYETILQTFAFIGKHQNINKIPKKLPIIFMAGREDPVGENGVIVREIYKQYQRFGMEQVELKIYDQDRHELLHELDRLTVFHDIYNWLETYIASASNTVEKKESI